MVDVTTILTDVGRVAFNGAITAVSAFVAVRFAGKVADKVEKPKSKADKDNK